MVGDEPRRWTIGRRLSLPPGLLLVGLPFAYFITAAFAIYLSAQVGNIAALWPATAILATALIRRPRGEWSVLLVIGGAADLASNILMGSSPALAAGMAAADILEAFLAAAFSLRFIASLHEFETRSLFCIFMLFAAATAAASGLGALWVAFMGAAGFWDSWSLWFFGDLLGLVIVAPLLLVWTDETLRRQHRPAFWVRLALHTGMVAVAAYLVFNVDQPFLFVIFPFLLFSTFRLGLFGATSGTSVVAFIAMWCTLQGHGPIIAAGLSEAEGIRVMQAFAAAAFLSTFPMAIMLERDRMMKAALGEARDQAEQATRAKADFLAMMSHEIRTPLNSVIGFTDLLLEDGRLDKRQRRHMELIHNAGAVLLMVVDDILDFSKIEAGKVTLSTSPFSIECLVDNSVSMVRHAAEMKGLDLVVEVDPKLTGFHGGDQGRLRQILLNLLNNAIKFTAAGGIRLEVACLDPAPDSDRVRFTVTDTGIGVPVARQHLLFGDFSQADASISREYGGTGLGLAICKRLLGSMGGDIGFSSSDREGSSFWFDLVLPRMEPEAGEAPHPTSAGSHRSARILLVEDLALNRELACTILRRAGHQVDVAANGEEAVKATRHEGYDLLLMDIQMPKLDGIAATKLIRSLRGPCRKAPIFAMSANVLPEQTEEYRRAGMNGHIAKPIRQAELHHLIEAILKQTEIEVSAGDGFDDGPPPVFDQLAYERVIRSFPPDAVAPHLRSVDAEIASAFEKPLEVTELREAAHKLVSLAGMLGFSELSSLCRELEHACAAAGPITEPLFAAKRAASEVRHRLAGLIAAAA